MYTLLGLIQTLLMLTQSRLMPDLGMLWEPKSESTAVVSHVTIVPANASGVSVGYISFLEAVRTKDKENWKPPAFTANRRSFPVLLQNKKRNGPVNIHKRYLVFCQLKTEG